MKKYVSIGIMLTLLGGKRVTAPELAQKYETSVKTIYRAIDVLVSAGMPIQCISGKGGGYELISESKINTNFFTKQELSSFISFIKSTNINKTEELDERINNIKDQSVLNEIKNKTQEIYFDTTTWGSFNNPDGIKPIMDAISSKNKLDITYSNEKRIIHPYTLVYKAGAWYVYAYCEKRKDFRLFKISRISKLDVLNDNFEKININTETAPWNEDFENNLEKIDMEILVSKDAILDIKEWLGKDIKIKTIHSESNIEYLVSAKAIFSIGLIHRLMQYSNKIKVLSPNKLKDALVGECLNIKNCY